MKNILICALVATCVALIVLFVVAGIQSHNELRELNQLLNGN